MIVERKRLFLAGVGVLFPWVWLGGNTLFYAWIPGYHGSITIFCFMVILGIGLATAASLTAKTNWRWRTLSLFFVQSILIIQIALVLGLLYVSMGFGTPQPRMEITSQWMRPLVSQWGRQSPGRDYSIKSVTDIKKNEENSLRFELRKGDYYADVFGKRSFRSEVNARDFPPIGSVRWHSLSLRLPPDFPIEATRLVLAQWHGADKKYLGEPSRSPALAFRYSGGRFSITIRYSDDRIVRNPESPSSLTLFETKEFPLDTWNDFVVQAKWSHKSDGFVRVWWDGEPIVRYSGPVGYNDDLGPYFKFGIYRDDSASTYVAYFNQVKLGVRPNEVGFDSPNEGMPEGNRKDR